MTMTRARLVVVAALLAGATLLPSRRAAAVLSMERVPELPPCADAASYPEGDDSPAAEHARRRCRLEQLEQRKNYERQWAAWVAWNQQKQTTQAWMDRVGIPARVTRRYAVDGFLATGFSHYGVTVAGILLPSLEAEVWLGFGNAENASNVGDLHDDRRCLGGRLKWLPIERGNLTPFFAGGAAGCTATLQFISFTGQGGGSDGSGVTHALTASLGATWTTTMGLRFSLEYIFAWAFYVQASDNTGAHPHDPMMQAAFENTLASDRHGVRFQVGYAF